MNNPLRILDILDIALRYLDDEPVSDQELILLRSHLPKIHKAIKDRENENESTT